ncbi:MAG: PaaI family thioesterase [Rhodospirillaceae bacterium]|jgi:uncharacterized protein (TIGR00369 family)
MPLPADLPPPDLEAVLAFYAEIPHHKAIGLDVVSAGKGRAVMRIGYDARFIGDPDSGAVHGGLVTTMMDATGGLAVLSAVPAGTPVATLDLRLDYLRAAEPGRVLIGEAECYRLTPNVAFTRGTAFEDGNAEDPVANFIATYMIKPVGIGMSGSGFAAGTQA